MKFLMFLLFALFILIASIGLTCIALDSSSNYFSIGILVFLDFYCTYFLIHILNIYVKIKQNKTQVEIRSLFKKNNYDLNELISWNENTYAYRVKVRKLQLIFKNGSVKITDTFDRKNIDNLYHYLRIHCAEKEI